MKEKFLVPINIPRPPRHTQIKPRCATCKKFPVCNIREDYLKTAFLIQEILGDPQEDRELRCCDCGFYGRDLENPSSYLSDALEVINPDETKEEPLTGRLQAIKYKNINFLQALYNVNGYSVVFKIFWDKAFERYTISDGLELYYNIKFKPVSYSIDDTALQAWRLEMIEKEEEEKSKEKDIINTTFFSAILNCDFYEQDKKLNEKEGWHRMELHWEKIFSKSSCPPIYHHLATYHIEPREVPGINSKFSPIPILYPVFVPKPSYPPARPPKRRDDVND